MDPNNETAPPAPAPATPGAPESTTPAATAPNPSLLAGAPAPNVTPAGGENPAPTPPGDAPPVDAVPEKFHVKREDGSLDEAATLAKLSKSYKELEAHKGAIPLPDVPETADAYTLEIKDAEGKPLDAAVLDEFKGDPLFQAFAKDALEQKFSQAQMNFAVQRYMDAVPKLMEADKQLTRDEASAELSKLWTNEQSFNANLVGAKSAITAYGGEADDVAGSRARLEEKFGNDPDFLAFAARIGSEMKEDRPATGTGVTSDMDVDALMKSPAYWNKNDPNHARVVAKVSEHYTAKHGTKAR